MIKSEGVTEDADLRRYVDMAIMFCAALPPKPGQKDRGGVQFRLGSGRTRLR